MPAMSRQSSKAESLATEMSFKRESPLATELTEELSAARVTAIKDEFADSAASSPSLQPIHPQTSRSSSSSTSRPKLTTSTSFVKKDEETNEDSTPKMEPDLPAKSSRSTSQKTVPRVAPLFDHLPDATAEAQSSFATMEACTYANKFLGYTEHAMECDCAEEWDASTKTNFACGDDSDCINRATKMECVGDCACGSACRNQRFQQREYANVSVIKTEKKGYGLRANTDLRNGDFIFEYIGEVINEPQFRRRMLQYDEQGIKHFYFMSLSKGEFVDATKKGNLGRFCNHSCNPNCYVDKWVVGDKLRMGIFAERKIKAGEELVFNYNVDRYGANPQPCYCGEANCTGFIGGKTQTERATKLSAATIEALGIEDADSWDTVVAKKPKKKKTGEDDEDYVEGIEAKELQADGVTKVMAALMQCKEKWIAVKLLQRIQRCRDEQVRNRVVKMHGYQIMNSQLAAWKEDDNVVLQILDILDTFPKITRNKIVDSKIEATLEPFVNSDDERVATKSKNLLDAWSKLEVAYRIPRKKRDPEELATPIKPESNRFERGAERREVSNQDRKRSRSRSRSPPRGPSTASAPSGPRASLPQRNNTFYPGPRPPPFNRTFAPLPRGWFQATANGKTYFYSASGQTTWARPTQPAEQPPPPPKQQSNSDVLKSIIDNIVTAREKERESKTTPDTPVQPSTERKEKKEAKWKSYDEDKKKKLYENTLFPHISHVMNKYKGKIPKEDLKRFAKDISKKLASSDFKAGRVADPTKLDEKHQQKVKKYCKDFFDKAAYKHKKHEQEKAAKRARAASGAKSSDMPSSIPSSEPPTVEDSPDVKKEDDEADDDEDVKMSDDDFDVEPPSPSKQPNGDTLKRKRSPSHAVKDEDGDEDDDHDDDVNQSPLKKPKSESPPPPPPPPAPPLESPPDATPAHSDDGMDVSGTSTNLHADTSFRSKSMADVLAEAQQDDDEEAMDTGMEDAHTKFEQGVHPSGLHDATAGRGMKNPMADGQDAVPAVKSEQEHRVEQER